MSNFTGEGVRRKNRLPMIAGVIALLLGNEASAQQARGRPMTDAEVYAENLARYGPEEMARRKEEERRWQTSPEGIATARQQAQSEREGRAYCATIKTRIQREGYRAVEADIGSMQMSDCGF